MTELSQRQLARAPVSQPPELSLFALLPTLVRTRRDSLAIFLESWRRGGDLVRLPALGQARPYLVVHPEPVKRILQDNWQNYEKTPLYHTLSRLFGINLLNADGEAWRWRRRLLQPGFRQQRLNEAEPLIREQVERMLERWSAFARVGQSIDALPEMMRLTLAIAVRAFFSTDLGAELDATRQAVMHLMAHTMRRMQTYPEVPDWLPLPSHRRFVRSVQRLHRLAERLIETRRTTAERPDDLLTLLLEGRDSTTGQPLTDRQLRDEIINTLLTGHETGAVTLTWVWYLLARHPEVLGRLRAELAEVLNGCSPTAETLPRLNYTRLVIQETLRLYPPVWSFSRRGLQDDRLGGYRIPAGSTLFLAPYLTHRHPEFWSDPERFQPERFLGAALTNQTRSAYFPFGGGPRLCIGNNFAVQVMVQALATIVPRFAVRLETDQAIGPRAMVLLWPRYPIRLRLEPRAAE